MRANKIFSARPSTAKDFRYIRFPGDEIQIAPSAQAFADKWNEQVSVKDTDVSGRRNRGLYQDVLTLEHADAHHRGRFLHSHKGKRKRNHRLSRDYRVKLQFMRFGFTGLGADRFDLPLPGTKDFTHEQQ